MIKARTLLIISATILWMVAVGTTVWYLATPAVISPDLRGGIDTILAAAIVVTLAARRRPRQPAGVDEMARTTQLALRLGAQLGVEERDRVAGDPPVTPDLHAV